MVVSASGHYTEPRAAYAPLARRNWRLPRSAPSARPDNPLFRLSPLSSPTRIQADTNLRWQSERGGPRGATPPHGYKDIAQLLLKHGADVNALMDNSFPARNFAGALRW